VIASTLLRKFGFCCALSAVLALALFAGSAAADVTIIQINPPPQTTVMPDTSCTGVPGTTTNTATLVGQLIISGDTLHFIGTLTQDYRSNWDDGTYLVSDTPTHIELNKNLVNGQAEKTEAQHDIATLYSADGQVLGHVQTVGGFHVTFAAGGTFVTFDSWHHQVCGA
jgi:hypothetical protein